MSATTFSRLLCHNPALHPNSYIAQLQQEIFAHNKLDGFRNELSMANWNSVTDKNCVDEAYEEFWNIYSNAYNRNFPLMRKRFNRNKHKINNFMTNGLLISRNTKKILHRTSISDPSAANIQKYKNFKTIYQWVICGAKRLYFTSKLEANVGNPKKPRIP
jgi:uncharacterized protein